jgi:hypothetical protein
MTYITNATGRSIDFDSALDLMDDDICEELDWLTGLEEQEAFNAYCATHLEKFGEEFEPNKANPVW